METISAGRMAFSTRPGMPFALGLLAGALIALILSLQFPAEDETTQCKSVNVPPPSEDSRYIYTARDWRVEQRRPQAAASAAADHANLPMAAKVTRLQFAAAELGIRDRLVVLIFGQSALSSAISALLVPHVSRVQIFMEASRVDSETSTLPNLTPYRQNGQYTHVHVLNSVFNLTFHENYDWFLFVSERSYVNPFALLRLIDELSWGVARAVGRRSSDGKCAFDAGVLLSNPSVQLLIQQRHLCGSITASSDQAAFEMCVQQATNLTCNENESSGTPFRWWRFEDGGEAGTAIHERVPSLRHSSAFNASVTVSPLLSELDARALHAHFVDVEIARVNIEIDNLAARLRVDETDYTARRRAESAADGAILSATDEGDGLSWPIGMPHAIKPTNRYQVPVWDYFTETELFRNWPNQNVQKLAGEDALDVAEIVAAARAKIKKTDDSDTHFLRLLGGYRVFNALRGLEYAVDLEYESVDSGTPISHRVHLCRPIAASELVESVPYVKEDMDITIVIPVESNVDVNAARHLFARQVRQCSAEGALGDKRQTRFVVAARRVDATVTHRLNEDLAALRQGCKTWNVETALLALKKPTENGKRALSLRVAAMAEAVDHYGQQTIFVLISPHTDYQREFLDRVRISTIRRYQVFAPIPFAEFNPLVSRADEILRRQSPPPGQFDEAVGDEPCDVTLAVQTLRSTAQNLSEEWPLVVHKDRGFFDLNDFDVFSVYGADFSLMHERFLTRQDDTKSAASSDENRTTADRGSLPVDVEDLILMAQDQLHVLRAIEPSLRARYRERHCAPDDTRCALAARATLGTKAQMANLTFRVFDARRTAETPLLRLQPAK